MEREPFILRFRYTVEESANAFLDGYRTLQRNGDPEAAEPRWLDEIEHWCVDIGPTTDAMGCGPLEIKDGVLTCYHQIPVAHDPVREALSRLLQALDNYDHDMGLAGKIEAAMHAAHVALGDPDAIAADAERTERGKQIRALADLLDSLL